MDITLYEFNALSEFDKAKFYLNMGNTLVNVLIENMGIRYTNSMILCRG